MKSTFRRQQNIGKFYHETFLVNTDRTPEFQPNAIYIGTYGESRIAPGGVIRFNTMPLLSQWCFEFIVDGQGRLTGSGESRMLYPGCLYIIRANSRAEIEVLPGHVLRKRVVTIEKSSTLSLLCNYDFRSGEEIVKLAEPQKIELIYDKIKAGCESGGINQKQELSILGYELLIELGRQQYQQQDEDPFKSLIMRIASDPAGNYTLENMAELLGVNVRTLTRRFSEKFGCSPMQYVIRQRLEYGRMLLSSGSMPVAEAAEACGYRSLPFFSRAFKQYFGVNPRTLK